MKTAPRLYGLSKDVSSSEDRLFPLHCPSIAGETSTVASTRDGTEVRVNIACGRWSSRWCGKCSIIGAIWSRKGVLMVAAFFTDASPHLRNYTMRFQPHVLNSFTRDMCRNSTQCDCSSDQLAKLSIDKSKSVEVTSDVLVKILLKTCLFSEG